ncbi:PQQ-binding-like beta-propeller repeat protein [Streptomyces sp. ISL-10]|uniref:outer membrane protein assembly factor BamB family protein n=1 Tax=Streptomyces sp. ISL-10 TaxID=2819172 RepID=UPI001BEAA99E|nr:PQQ-binding-like beta-propeller repeat protein [Streptomyces sp. ISL-10]
MNTSDRHVVHGLGCRGVDVVEAMAVKRGTPVRVAHRPAASLVLAAAATMTLLTGCSSGSPEGGKPSGQGAGPSTKAYDPPRKFGKGVKLSADENANAEVALRGTTAYLLNDDGLEAYNTRTGSKLWTVSGPDGMSTGVEERFRLKDDAPPVLAQQSGRTLALFAYQAYTPGSGTTADVSSAHLRAVDADTGKVSWTAELPVPAGESFVDDSTPTVVGAESGTAVVTVRTTPEDGNGETRSAITYGVDLNSHQVNWRQDDFGAAALESGTVVGAQLPDAAQIDSERWFADDGGIGIVGRSASDGAVRWKDSRNLYGLKIERVGAGLFSAEVNVEFKENPSDFELLDTGTGKLPSGMTKDSSAAISGLGCVYDQRSVVVCEGEGSLAALDARTHKVLWRMSDDDPARKVPTFLTTWHGAVYGHVAGNGYVILDASTGKDRGTYDEGFLRAVNEYGGLDQDLTVYPATG